MKISKRSKITSSKETADRKTDRRIFPTNVRYKGYMIRLDRGGDGYNVYDKYGELEDAGYTSIEKAKEFVNELVNEAKGSYVRSSIDEDSKRSYIMKRIIKNSVTSSKSTNPHSEYEYRKNVYLKRKHEFETLGEADNNDVLSREEKMNLAKAEMDKVAPKSVNSASTNVTEAKMIDDLDYFYEVYPEDMEPILIRNGANPDKDNWLDGCNIPQAYNEAVAYFESNYDNDDEYSELDTGVGSRLGWSNYIQSGIYEETEDPKWICLDIKHVRDSDGMLTDYALYTTKDEDKYICMFGDADVYAPDEMYADAEFDTEEEALEWFENYVGPGDEEDEDDIYSSEETDAEEDDDLDHPDQEYDSAATSINSTKLPAIYRMVKLQPGTVGVDFGGGKFNNAIDYLRDQDVTLCVYDPYNRSAEHNREVLRTLRANGGADFAINSNVLNVIKEPEARKGVLENIKKITKSGAPIYITVYEGRGDAKEGVTKSGYQLNRKTADYLEEIQEVFPDAKRKGKLIVATNKGSANSSVDIKASSEIIWDDLDWNQQIQVMKRYIRNYKGTRIFEDFADYINKPVEDIIDSFCDAESRGDIRIPERMQLDSEYRNDDIYSSTTLSSRYWYFTRHGVQPGSVPKYVNILDIVDKPEGSYFLADGVILTKDLRDYDIKERKPEDSVTSSTRIEYSDILEEIREQCNTKLIHIMAQYGFDESEAKQYSRVDASIKDNQYGRIEIGCELDYDGLMRVCQELDPIVQAYDPDSYFEPIDPGIAEACVNLEKASIDSSSNIQAGAYDFLEPSLDPPEYPEPEEGEEKVEVECDINQLEITVEEDGSWEYQRDDFLDEMLTAENEITSEEYDVYIRDRNGLIEDFDSIVEPNIPGVPGTYLISCHVKMVYDVTGVEIVREYQGKDEDGDPIVDEDYYTGSADVDFNRNDSYITNFYSEEI